MVTLFVFTQNNPNTGDKYESIVDAEVDYIEEDESIYIVRDQLLKGDKIKRTHLAWYPRYTVLKMLFTDEPVKAG